MHASGTTDVGKPREGARIPISPNVDRVGAVMEMQADVPGVDMRSLMCRCDWRLVHITQNGLFSLDAVKWGCVCAGGIGAVQWGDH